MNKAKEFLRSKGFTDFYFDNDGVVPTSEVIELLESYATTCATSLPTEEEIKKWAFDQIPHTPEGCIEDDIDHAKRQLLIRGATWAISNESKQREEGCSRISQDNTEECEHEYKFQRGRTPIDNIHQCTKCRKIKYSPLTQQEKQNEKL